MWKRTKLGKIVYPKPKRKWTIRGAVRVVRASVSPLPIYQFTMENLKDSLEITDLCVTKFLDIRDKLGNKEMNRYINDYLFRLTNQMFKVLYEMSIEEYVYQESQVV